MKELGGWSKGGSKIPETALDDKGIERGGKERLEVWKEAFRKLGTDDPNDPDFDRNWARKIESDVRQIEARNRKENEETEEKRDDDDDDDEVCDEEEKAHRKELHENITQEEVGKAIDQLQNYRAPGQDGVIGEILKTGGDKIREVVWMLCCIAWRAESIPTEWRQGIVVPLHKDGDERDPMNYRGITLLSIVGKVFTRVLNNRLTKFAERKTFGIVEEQGGFRPERGTEDQIFILTEVLKARSGRTTYTAFIDVKKAYDTVWRDGLWIRLWEEGVRGKMWRMIREMYRTVQSSVLVDGEQTEMFELNTGVRHGCVMSPVLFSFFINGLAKEINKRTKGICVGDRKVRLLMYADDIVLMSETKRDLQNMLDVVTTYSKKWRFRLNPKKGKSEVMIFGRKPRKTGEDRIWKLAGEEVQETESYKYLGVELVSRLGFKKLSKEADNVGVGYGDERRRVATQRLLHSLECACAAGA